MSVGDSALVLFDSHSVHTITYKKLMLVKFSGHTFPSYFIAFESVFERVVSSTSTVLPVGTVEEQEPHRISCTL